MVHLICCTALAFVPGTHKLATTRAPAASPVMVIGQQASSFGPASLLRKLKADLPQFPWLAEGDGAPRNKIDMPDHVKAVLAQPTAPTREAESAERTDRIRSRAQQAAADAAALRGMLVGSEDEAAWWRTQRNTPKGGRAVTKDDPLTVLVAGGGLAGLVTASACHALGMKVAIFEQASTYAPYGGPIQIQSNALRALSRISPTIVEELIKAGTCTADRVSGLKIGYRKGNKLAGVRRERSSRRHPIRPRSGRRRAPFPWSARGADGYRRALSTCAAAVRSRGLARPVRHYRPGARGGTAGDRRRRPAGDSADPGEAWLPGGHGAWPVARIIAHPTYLVLHCARLRTALRRPLRPDRACKAPHGWASCARPAARAVPARPPPPSSAAGPHQVAHRDF